MDLTLDDNGRCLKTGRFMAGFAKAGPGRPKGSRNKLTQNMLDRFSRATEDGISPEDILMGIYQDPEAPAELRYKAASKMADLIYPKASSVEVKMDDKEGMTSEQVDEKLQQLLALAAM